LEFNVPFQHKYGYIRDEQITLAKHHTHSEVYSLLGAEVSVQPLLH